MHCYSGEVAALHARGYQGQGIRIGQLDTGVDGALPALAGRIERFRWFAANGFSDEAAEATDSVSHGTHAAGLLVGGACDGRPIGIAPAARLHCGAVIEAGNVVARMLLGLDWLAESGVSVVCLPIGVRGVTPVFRTMIRAMAHKDILVVCAIGNGGAGAACTPGCYPEALSVGSCGPDGRAARFSGSLNHAQTQECCRPDVVASGVDVLSLAAGGGTVRLSGTSVSSAIVAGIASLLRQAFPEAPATSIKRAITASAQPLSADQSHRARYGRLCPSAAFAALEQSAGATSGQTESPGPMTLPAIDKAAPDTRAGRRANCSDAAGGDMIDAAMVVARRVDLRLAERLARCRDDDPAEAVLEFSSVVEARHAVLRLRADKSGQPRWRLLNNAPVIILRAPTSTIRGLLESPSVVIASACDIDRAFL